jgi:hypothetical protein
MQKIKYMMFNIVFLLIIVVLLIIGLSSNQLAIADPLKNSILQRIGNYNIEMKTDPKLPIAGQNTQILLRISSVNGDELVDIPIVITIVKDGVNLEKTHPIFVPYNHFTHEYVFSKSGIYTLNIDINDNGYSGQSITFTYPINVLDSFAVYFSSSLLLPVASVVISVIVAGTVLVNRRKKNSRKTIEHKKT